MFLYLMGVLLCFFKLPRHFRETFRGASAPFRACSHTHILTLFWLDEYYRKGTIKRNGSMLHVWYITVYLPLFTYQTEWFLGQNVGKYSSTMVRRWWLGVSHPLAAQTKGCRQGALPSAAWTRPDLPFGSLRRPCRWAKFGTLPWEIDGKYRGNHRLFWDFQWIVL